MKCIRATNDLGLVRKWLKALAVLYVEDIDLEATGDWMCKDGEIAFLDNPHAMITWMGRRWCTIVTPDGDKFDARPLRDLDGRRYGRIQITWEED